MKRSVEATGRTVDEAVQTALAQLGVERQHATVEILEAPSKGLFGLIGQRDARVRVTINRGKADFAREFVQTVAEKLQLDVLTELVEDGQQAEIRIYGPDVSYLIGRRGQTLNALEFLTNLAAGRISDERLRIQLDAEGYRKRRAQVVANLAKKAAQRVLRSGKSTALEPMPAAERRAVHLALKRMEGVVTRSEGEEPFRRVVILPQRHARRANA